MKAKSPKRAASGAPPPIAYARFAAGQPIGHQELVARLDENAAAFASDAETRLHHAYILSGPPGVGKFHTAYWWARRLLCRGVGSCADASSATQTAGGESSDAKTSEGQTSEGQCRSCRLAAAGAHPDILVLEAPENRRSLGITHIGAGAEKRKTIGVDTAREVMRRMNSKATEGSLRIAILADADLLTPQAQNALLKFLEEPSGHRVIMLVVDNPGRLLPTVRSRCQHLRFGALEEEEVATIVENLGMDPVMAKAAAAVALGSVGRALLLDAEELEARERVLLSYENLLQKAGAIEPLLEELIERKDRGYGLDELYAWEAKKTHAGLGHSPSEASPTLATLLEQADRHVALQSIGRADKIRRTTALLARNANAKIALRDMLFNIGS